MTLVEVVVALAVIGVVAAAFALLMVMTLGTSRTHEQRVTANQLGQNQLESVVAQPWSSIGLHSGDSGYTATANGENTVTLSGASGANSIQPTSTVTKSGINYTVVTNITWTDDPNDGLGSSDANGSTQDDKHVLVTVSWTTSGQTRTVTLDDLRTPTATEVPPVAGSAFSVTLTAPSSQLLTSSGLFSSAMDITATTSKVASSVTLKYTTRDGQQHSVPMSNLSGGTSWKATLDTTTGPFDTDLTTFSVAATTGGLNASKTTTVQLLGSGNSTASLSVLAAPSQTLSATNTLSSAITITATGGASISSGTVTFPTAGAGSPLTRNLTGSGTSWSYTLPVDTTTYNSGLEVFTVSVTFADGTTRTWTDSITLDPAIVLPDVTNLVVNPGAGTSGFCVDGSYKLYSTSTVDATVKNVATTDRVYLLAPQWMAAPGLAMTYLKTNADGSMVFRYTVLANSQLPSASSIQLQASATKTVSGTDYSDNFITSPNVVIQSWSNKNKCT
jgi:Tfp pilus assembly protein PilV